MTSERAQVMAPALVVMVVAGALALGSGCGAASRDAYASNSAPAESRVYNARQGGALGVDGVADDASGKKVARKFVRTSSVTLEVDDEDDFAPTLERARDIARGMGGFIKSESTTSMSMMVPTERLDEALKLIAKLGKITSKHISIRDVTSQYVDLQIRIDNLRKMRDRLTQLLAQSKDVKDVLEVERELGRVTTELERLEGQMRVMSQQTTYASIYLRLEEEVTPGPIGWVFYGLAVGVKWLFVWD